MTLFLPSTQPDSGLPGAEETLTPEPGYEPRSCFVFLPLGMTNLSPAAQDHRVLLNCLPLPLPPLHPLPTPGEDRIPGAPAGVSTGWSDADAHFLDLHLIPTLQHKDPFTGELSCAASWDAAAHDDPNLLRITKDQSRIYMRLQVRCAMANQDVELVLNKLICFKICKRDFKLKPTMRQRLSFSAFPTNPRGCGAVYEVSNCV